MRVHEVFEIYRKPFGNDNDYIFYLFIYFDKDKGLYLFNYLF